MTIERSLPSLNPLTLSAIPEMRTNLGIDMMIFMKDLMEGFRCLVLKMKLASG